MTKLLYCATTFETLKTNIILFYLPGNMLGNWQVLVSCKANFDDACCFVYLLQNVSAKSNVSTSSLSTGSTRRQKQAVLCSVQTEDDLKSGIFEYITENCKLSFHSITDKAIIIHVWIFG